MSILQSSFKVQSGEYNFLSDPFAGATGVIDLGVFIPKNSIIYGFWVNALTAFTSAGAATISFGFEDQIAAVINPTAYMVANAFGAFAVNVPLAGVDLYANPIKQLNTTQVLMAIGGAAITGGRAYFDIWYQEHDF
jgi:hypothetical protein